MNLEQYNTKGNKSDDGEESHSPASNNGKKPLVMTNQAFLKLRNMIYDFSGIYYTESKKYLLESRIAKRVVVKNLKSFEEYINFLNSANNKQELHFLFEAITINETFFFRAEQQFAALETTIASEILNSRLSSMSKANQNNKLLNTKVNQSANVFRIWSAACSTGEEAYTMAMIILEKLKPLYPNIQFQIIASDINKQVIETAKRGIYRDYAIRNVPLNYLSKYFKKEGQIYKLSDEVKNIVRFIELNLYDHNAMKTINNCDVIFCANVLIYFDLPSKQKVVSYLYDTLNKGGYLFIGYSESLHGISKSFKLIHLPKAMAYRKD